MAPRAWTGPCATSASPYIRSSPTTPQPCALRSGHNPCCPNLNTWFGLLPTSSQPRTPNQEHRVMLFGLWGSLWIWKFGLRARDWAHYYQAPSKGQGCLAEYWLFAFLDNGPGVLQQENIGRKLHGWMWDGKQLGFPWDSVQVQINPQGLYLLSSQYI